MICSFYLISFFHLNTQFFFHFISFISFHLFIHFTLYGISKLGNVWLFFHFSSFSSFCEITHFWLSTIFPLNFIADITEMYFVGQLLPRNIMYWMSRTHLRNSARCISPISFSFRLPYIIHLANTPVQPMYLATGNGFCIAGLCVVTWLWIKIQIISFWKVISAKWRGIFAL